MCYDRYCDLILKKGPGNISDENQMEATQNDVVSLFKYLSDKDVFMMVYSKLLSKRLINDISASEDAENAMIVKLKVILFLAPLLYINDTFSLPKGSSIV